MLIWAFPARVVRDKEMISNIRYRYFWELLNLMMVRRDRGSQAMAWTAVPNSSHVVISELRANIIAPVSLEIFELVSS